MTSKLHQTRLGPLTVGAQGFGAMGIGTGYYGETDATEARRTLDRALDLGVTLFDTADAYGDGTNETFLASFLKANRGAVTIATKYGIRVRDGGAIVDNAPAYIREAVEGSLKRLGVETIDLYYMHRRDPAVPLPDSIGAMAELVSAGKVRHLGLSEVSGAELAEAHAIHPIAAVQTEWSLFSRGVENDVVPTAARLGVGFVPYSPLGRGQLTGAVSGSGLSDGDVRRTMDRFSDENRDANTALVEGLRRLSAAREATPAQMALAWLHHQSEFYGLGVVPIPGTRRVERVEENVAGARIKLSPDELLTLQNLATTVRGTRSRTI